MTQWHTYPTNVTGIGDLFIWGNEVVGGLLGNILVGAVFLVTLISLSYYSRSSKAIPTAFFITTILAIILSRLNIVSPILVIVGIIGTIIGVLMSAYESPYG